MGQGGAVPQPFGWLLVRLGRSRVRRGEGDASGRHRPRDPRRRRRGRRVPRGHAVDEPDAVGSPHHGAGRLAAETGADRVPTAILGTSHLWLGPLPKPRRIDVSFLAPVPADAQALIDEHVWPAVQEGVRAAAGHAARDRRRAGGGRARRPARCAGRSSARVAAPAGRRQAASAAPAVRPARAPTRPGSLSAASAPPRQAPVAHRRALARLGVRAARSRAAAFAVEGGQRGSVLRVGWLHAGHAAEAMPMGRRPPRRSAATSCVEPTCAPGARLSRRALHEPRRARPSIRAGRR